MKAKLVTFLALAWVLLGISGAALAHHGNVAYDEMHPITISGKVTEFVWSNPHCQIYLDVKDAKGKFVSWSVESQSPGILRRNGWTRTIIKAGDQVTVTLAPARNGAPVGFSGEELGKVVLTGGRVLKMNVR
jgi:Family of unknown function (DUF6152)